MALTPGYGQTPVPEEERGALTEHIRILLGEDATKADLYDLEQAVQEEVTERLLAEVIEGDLSTDDLLTDHFVRDVHHLLYGDIWTWAGVLRRRELNIGVASEYVAVELRTALGTIAYRWRETDDWTPRILGVVTHAEIVRVHPFTDGNGRLSRLMADLVFAAAQDSDQPDLYEWSVDKRRYIDLLRRYDRDRDPVPLATLIGIRPLGA